MASKGDSLKESSSSSYYPSVGGYPARRPTGVDMALGLSGYAVKVSFSYENLTQSSESSMFQLKNIVFIKPIFIDLGFSATKPTCKSAYDSSAS